MTRGPRNAASRSQLALELMTAFADRTVLTSDGPPDRYLWTDAFAVCNFLTLGRTDMALQLVDQVHAVLGRFGPGDARVGWLSGLDDESAREHPTIGGLRIGKQLAERGPRETIDPRLEWERDGQYFHYLTKWMHALDQVARATDRPDLNRWARELAATAFRAFAVADPGGMSGPRHMYWKMSVDLTRPLVASMGHHDPLDGYVTCCELQVTAARLGARDGPDLRAEAAAFGAMIPADLATDDLLGIGGLLCDAWRVEQLSDQDEGLSGPDVRDRLLDAAVTGLAARDVAWDLALPADERLAFRELGLAIGLAAVRRMAESSAGGPAIDRAAGFVDIGSSIEMCWLDPVHRRNQTWTDHRNINDVMLATCLQPDGFLIVRPRSAAAMGT